MLLLFKVASLTLYRCSYSGLDILGHSRKHPHLPHGGNWKLTPLPPLDVLIQLLLSETIFYPLPYGRQKFLLWGECGHFLE
jgi:hypothetical protein